jgi:hypothetical protein
MIVGLASFSGAVALTCCNKGIELLLQHDIKEKYLWGEVRKAHFL